VAGRLNSRSIHHSLYATALVAEIVLLYCGVNFLLLGYMPLKHRLIGSGVCFPMAALASWWSGLHFVRSLPEERKHGARVRSTFPVVLFFWVFFAALIAVILVLTGFL